MTLTMVKAKKNAQSDISDNPQLNVSSAINHSNTLSLVKSGLVQVAVHTHDLNQLIGIT